MTTSPQKLKNVPRLDLINIEIKKKISHDKDALSLLEKFEFYLKSLRLNLEEMLNSVTNQDFTSGTEKANYVVNFVTDLLPTRFIIIDHYDEQASFQDQLIRMQTQNTNNNPRNNLGTKLYKEVATRVINYHLSIDQNLSLERLVLLLKWAVVVDYPSKQFELQDKSIDMSNTISDEEIKAIDDYLLGQNEDFNAQISELQARIKEIEASVKNSDKKSEEEKKRIQA